MARLRHWSLGAKLALVGTPFLLIGMCLIGLTLWVTWQLDGGAAAVNEAGRMRMQTYRLSLSAATGDQEAFQRQAGDFEASIVLLRNGDIERPLVVPWDAASEHQFAVVTEGWTRFRAQAEAALAAGRAAPVPIAGDAAAFVGEIDRFVSGIERHLAYWTMTLHLLQIGVMVLGGLGATFLLYAGYMFVLEPVGRLKFATERIQQGELGARVDVVTTDEFGALAEGFNDMAGHLQAMHHNLEARVVEKTAQLAEKTERLQALYDITTLTTNATTLQELADGFAERVACAIHADGVAVRWTDAANQRYTLLAARGLPPAVVESSRCLEADRCFCGATASLGSVRLVTAAELDRVPALSCRTAGFASLVAVPVRLHDRLMGEVDLFFHAEVTLTAAERSLLDALAAHLAGAMENLRLNALEKETAVAQERTFLASELHDSIAQSLAFLKIQVQLMRDALGDADPVRVSEVLEEIDAGVRECYGDVRELLVHFRTRTRDEDIEAALSATLSKFAQQSGLEAALSREGQGVPLDADVQIQVLHIVQEALSNVRKHAHATQVRVRVLESPFWSFEVQDDGIGFDAAAESDSTCVGLRIMAERAEKIGGVLRVESQPGRGTRVLLQLPRSRSASSAEAPAEAANDGAAVVH